MSISRITDQYINENPSIKDSLQKGFINYSKLARNIIKETNLKKEDFDAVLVSLTRIERKLKKKQTFQRKIRDVLKDTKLEIKTKIMVCIIEKNTFYKNIYQSIIGFQKEVKKREGMLHIVEGIDVITLITEQEFENLVKRFFGTKIKKRTKDLVEIILRSPDSLENVPGVVGYLYSLFSDKGINIVETLSCWTDTFFVIEKKDLEKAVEILDF